MAGPSAGVKVEGLNQVLRSMKAAGVDLNDLKPEMRKASTILGDRLRAETPKKSGRMASTIREGTAARKASVKIGRNGSKFAYAPVLNYAKKSRHKGFIERAVKQATPPVLRSLEEGVTNVLRQNNL